MPITYDWPASIQPAAEARLYPKVLDASFASPYTGQISLEPSHNETWVYELSWPVMSTDEGHALELLLAQLQGRRNWVRIPVWHHKTQAPLNFNITASTRARVVTASTDVPLGAFFTVGDTLKRCLNTEPNGLTHITPLCRQSLTASPATTVAPHGLFRLLDTDAAVDWEGCEPSFDGTFVEAF